MRQFFLFSLLCVLTYSLALAQHPRLSAAGSCTTTDSMFLGGSSTQRATIANIGDAPLIVSSVVLGGPESSTFTISSISNPRTNNTYGAPFTLDASDTVIVTLVFRPTIVGQSEATLTVTGRDTGNTMMFDTVVRLCNKGYASGIIAGSVHLEQYVTLIRTDSIAIRNTGAGPLQVSDITSTSPDVLAGYLTYTTDLLPFNISPNDTKYIAVTFNPRDLHVCRRNFAADFVIENSTGTPISAHATARGHEIDMHSYIDRNYQSMSQSDPVVHVIVDTLRDTLAEANISGFIMEMYHYKRTLIQPDVSFNESGQGFVNCVTQGALCAQNVLENNLQDSAHNFGTQGYYEINVALIPANLAVQRAPFPLLDVKFHALVGLDTSELLFNIKNPIDRSNNVMPYVNSTASPGLITVDSAAPIAVREVSPTSTSVDGSISLSLPHAAHVTLTIYDEIGREASRAQDLGFVSAGVHTLPVDLHSLPAGMYFCHVHAGEVSKVVRVVKMD